MTQAGSQSVRQDDATAMADFFRELARVAAAETLPHFRTAIAVDNKLNQGFDPVTEADRRSEQAIRAAIEARFPGDGIDGEEFGRVRMDARDRWVIDPIDGTRSFICGMPLWGTLVGRMEDGVATAGLLSQPYLGENYIADGDHAFLESRDGRRDLRVSGCTSAKEARLFSTTPDMWRDAEAEGFSRLRETVELCRFGADCYAFGLLAAGLVDIVVESGLKSYDIMALIPIIRSAGGVIGRTDGGPAEDAGTIIAASSQALFDEAQALLNG